jgi:hypothetical protein
MRWLYLVSATVSLVAFLLWPVRNPPIEAALALAAWLAVGEVARLDREAGKTTAEREREWTR